MGWADCNRLGDIENLYIRDHIAASQKDAIRMAINAGVDMMMVPS